MFIHVVLFEIKPKEVRGYRKDTKMWARFARETKGFIGYCTVKRVNPVRNTAEAERHRKISNGVNARNQYASVYKWKTKVAHDRFMNKLHDWLVSKSQAKVKVLGYYNLKAIGQMK